MVAGAMWAKAPNSDKPVCKLTLQRRRRRSLALSTVLAGTKCVKRSTVERSW
jgi:hypothetical protein